MRKELLKNHDMYLERKKLYAGHGFDIDKERKFVLDRAEPLYGYILEVGTGKGHFTLTLAKEGYEFTSVDISKEEQDIAILNLRYCGLENKVKFLIEDAEQLSFEDKSVDVILSINTAHHLKDPYKVLDQFIRIVSFEGKIVISDFNDKGFGILEKIHADEGRTHSRSDIAMRDIEQYIRGKGFQVKRYESEYQDVLIAFMQVV